MIISCPHCHTRYQLEREVIGSAGRKVKCAHCHRDWRALPATDPAPDHGDDSLFDEIEEDRLDEAFTEAERAQLPAVAGDPAAPAATPAEARRPADTGPLRQKLKALARREKRLMAGMPEARLRRGVRVALAAILLALIAGLGMLRAPIVATFPSLADLYSAIGLPVNLVGLEFDRLHTVKSLSGGAERLVIRADLVSVSDRPVPVPPIIVGLTNAEGAVIYEWSAPPPAPRLAPGASVGFETELPLPPAAATGVELSFAPETGAARKTAGKPAKIEGSV